MLEKNFDFVVGNPPWLSSLIARKDYQKVISLLTKLKSLVQGKFNLSLLFSIVSYQMTNIRGGLILPLGILTETYSSKFRELLTKAMELTKIIVLTNNKFPRVTNEYVMIFWDRKEKAKNFQVVLEKEKKLFSVKHDFVSKPKFLIPLIPTKLYSFIREKTAHVDKLGDLCVIRRGLTLTRRYKDHYKKIDTFKDSSSVKKLICHNNYSLENKEGVYNFQLFYNGNKLLYDPELLGAPGTPSLFEQPKIVRRNRGKLWFIALDADGEFFVNDIFDVIVPKEEKNYDIVTLFGYLSSSFVQYLIENYLQRDITSNVVREIPVIIGERKNEIYTLTKKWRKSITKVTTIEFRERIDGVIFEILKLPEKFKLIIKKQAPLRWINA